MAIRWLGWLTGSPAAAVSSNGLVPLTDRQRARLLAQVQNSDDLQVRDRAALILADHRDPQLFDHALVDRHLCILLMQEKPSEFLAMARQHPTMTRALAIDLFTLDHYLPNSLEPRWRVAFAAEKLPALLTRSDDDAAANIPLFFRIGTQYADRQHAQALATFLANPAPTNDQRLTIQLASAIMLSKCDPAVKALLWRTIDTDAVFAKFLAFPDSTAQAALTAGITWATTDTMQRIMRLIGNDDPLVAPALTSWISVALFSRTIREFVEEFKDVLPRSIAMVDDLPFAAPPARQYLLHHLVDAAARPDCSAALKDFVENKLFRWLPPVDLALLRQPAANRMDFDKSVR